MSRRLVIVASLLALGVAVWVLRGGDSPAPESRDEQPHVASIERTKDRPRARDAGAERDASRRAPLRDAARPERRTLGALPDPEFRRPAPDRTVVAADELDELIRTATQDPDPTERAAAIADLSIDEDLAVIVSVVRQTANDPDPEVKLAVVAALAQLGEAVPIDLLTQFANDPDPEVRFEVLSIVEVLSEEDSVPGLVAPILDKATRDPDDDVRQRAIDINESLAETRETN